VNQRLQNRRDRLGEEAGLLCYPVEMQQTAVKQRYGLDDFFFLYPVAVQDKQACLALGTDALYLHCHVMEEAEGNDSDDDLIGGVNRGGFS
jgi:CRISPR-associated endonuclease/helicase Cas3